MECIPFNVLIDQLLRNDFQICFWFGKYLRGLDHVFFNQIYVQHFKDWESERNEWLSFSDINTINMQEPKYALQSIRTSPHSLLLSNDRTLFSYPHVCHHFWNHWHIDHQLQFAVQWGHFLLLLEFDDETVLPAARIPMNQLKDSGFGMVRVFKQKYLLNYSRFVLEANAYLTVGLCAWADLSSDGNDCDLEWII